jgi:hypothetical protein
MTRTVWPTPAFQKYSHPGLAPAKWAGESAPRRCVDRLPVRRSPPPGGSARRALIRQVATRTAAGRSHRGSTSLRLTEGGAVLLLNLHHQPCAPTKKPSVLGTSTAQGPRAVCRRLQVTLARAMGAPKR